jgi:hypothetical protein
MFNKLKIIFLTLYLLLFINFFSFAYTFEKNTSLPPLRMNYEDLNNILKSMRNQLVITLTAEEQDKLYQRIKISGADTTLEKEGNFILSKDDPLPDIGYELYYNFSNKFGPIYEVTLFFRDYKRTISIKGNSQDAVESINLFLLNKLENKSTLFAGNTMRLSVLIGLVVLSWIIIGSALNKKELINSFRIVFILMGGIIIIGSFILLFNDKTLSGFEIYKDSVSFIIKYSAEISFIALLLTILLFPIGIYINYKLSSKRKVEI